MALMATQRRGETAVKTNEIMARFRPIAPKPVVLAPPPTNAAVLSSQRRSRSWHGGRDLVPSSYPYPIFRASPWNSSDPEAAPASSRRVELDLLRKPRGPAKVIAPRPARPVRTTICVDTSSVTGANSAKLAARRTTTATQVVSEMERDALPAVVSSGPGGNRVVRANDAYKALVGQPVCPWLDSLPGGDASRRINGEVVLDVRRFNSAEPTRASGAGGTFSCKSRISWERDDGTLASVAAPCDVTRFDCSSGGTLFVWRFDTSRGSVFYCPA